MKYIRLYQGDSRRKVVKGRGTKRERRLVRDGASPLGDPGGREGTTHTTERSLTLTLTERANTAEASAVALLTSALVPADGDTVSGNRRGNASTSRNRCTASSLKSDSARDSGGSGSGDGSSNDGAVLSHSSLLELGKRLLNGRVDSKDHTAATMVAGALLAVPPRGLKGSDGVVPSGSRDDGAVGVGEKTRVKLGLGLPHARLSKGGLGHRVVLLQEDEVDNITDIGLNVLGGVNEATRTTNSNLNMLE